MDENFWINKWTKNEIGFHQNEYHTNLKKLWTQFTKDEHGAVFVPLCGKSLDMVFFLEKKRNVYGVDLSNLALKSFFIENKLNYSLNENCYYNKDISLYHNDIFKLDTTKIKDIKFIYDRAALVALPPKVRELYSSWLHKSFPYASIFLETFEFDNTEVGPPFSISNEMINNYYGKSYHIEEQQFISAELDKIKIHKNKISKVSMRTTFLTPK